MSTLFRKALFKKQKVHFNIKKERSLSIDAKIIIAKKWGDKK